MRVTWTLIITSFDSEVLCLALGLSFFYSTFPILMAMSINQARQTCANPPASTLCQTTQCIQSNITPSTSLHQDTEPVLDDLLQAMCHALIIYFYQRIYNIDADMPQTHVVGVCDCLLRLESTDFVTSVGSARLLWPAFIAACEAEDAAVRPRLLNGLGIRRCAVGCHTSTLRSRKSKQCGRQGVATMPYTPCGLI